MNEFEKQILTNQRELLYVAMVHEMDTQRKERLRQCEEDTAALHNPKRKLTVNDLSNAALYEDEFGNIKESSVPGIDKIRDDASCEENEVKE